jgi:hypothetical protein
MNCTSYNRGFSITSLASGFCVQLDKKMIPIKTKLRIDRLPQVRYRESLTRAMKGICQEDLEANSYTTGFNTNLHELAQLDAEDLPELATNQKRDGNID